MSMYAKKIHLGYTKEISERVQSSVSIVQQKYKEMFVA